MKLKQNNKAVKAVPIMAISLVLFHHSIVATEVEPDETVAKLNWCFVSLENSQQLPTEPLLVPSFETGRTCLLLSRQKTGVRVFKQNLTERSLFMVENTSPAKPGVYGDHLELNIWWKSL